MCDEARPPTRGFSDLKNKTKNVVPLITSDHFDIMFKNSIFCCGATYLVKLIPLGFVCGSFWDRRAGTQGYNHSSLNSDGAKVYTTEATFLGQGAHVIYSSSSVRCLALCIVQQYVHVTYLNGGLLSLEYMRRKHTHKERRSCALMWTYRALRDVLLVSMWYYSCLRFYHA